MNEVKRLIKCIEKEEDDLFNQIKKYKTLLDASDVDRVIVIIDPNHGYKTYDLIDINGNIIDYNNCTNYNNYANYAYTIDMIYNRVSYLLDLKDYLNNLNIIYKENEGPLGVYCDGLNVLIDENKLEQYTQTQKTVIISFYSLLPLSNIYFIGAKGYNGKKGEYELGSICLLLRYLGISNEKPKYSISKRIEQGYDIEGIKLILPPNNFKFKSLMNFLKNDNPFFKISEKINLPNNTDKCIIKISQNALRINQGNGIHIENSNFIVFMENDNKFIDKRDKDVKDYFLSEKIIAQLIS